MTKQIKILVAEDDANIALALKMILRKAVGGVEVTIVADGQQALDKVSEARYDLLISDWHMPKLSGVELLEALRNNQQLDRLPFLMLTARSDLASVKKVLGARQADYISKPFGNDEVVEKVRNLLGLPLS